MKACSFLPAVTQMIYDMDLQHHLHGVTYNCPLPARCEKEIVIGCLLPKEGLNSAEPNNNYSRSRHKNHSLYKADELLLEKISPDIIFTSAACNPCQVDALATMRTVAKLKSNPRIIGISPTSLEEVLETALTIATALGEPARGIGYIRELRNKIDAVSKNLLHYQLAPKKVLVLEWLNPLYNCGHWIADQVALAGGIDMLNSPHRASRQTPWEKIRGYNPQVIIVATGGLCIESTLNEMELLTQLPDWGSMDAVKNENVFAVDYSLMAQPSAAMLVLGIEVLAFLFNPYYFAATEHTHQVTNVSYSSKH